MNQMVISSNRDHTIDLNEHYSPKPMPNRCPFKVGQRVRIDNTSEGTLRFYGPVKFQPGIWAGIELDTANGKNDGLVQGIRYFCCEPNHGVFVSASRVLHAGDSSIVLTTPTRTRQEHMGSLRVLDDHSLSVVDLQHVDPNKENMLLSRENPVSNEVELTSQIRVPDTDLVRKLQAQIETMSQEHSAEMSELIKLHDAEIREKSQSLQFLEQQFEKLVATYNNLEREAAVQITTSEEVNRHKETMDKMSGHNKHLQTQNDRLHKEIELLTDRNLQLEEKITELAKTIESQADFVEELKTDLAAAALVQNNRDELIDVLREELRIRTTCSEPCDSQVDRLKKELAHQENEKLYGFTVLSYVYQSLRCRLTSMRKHRLPNKHIEIEQVDAQLLKISEAISLKNEELQCLFKV